MYHGALELPEVHSSFGCSVLLSLDIFAPYNGTLRVYIYVSANQLLFFGHVRFSYNPSFSA